jgi:hypothetical protein
MRCAYRLYIDKGYNDYKAFEHFTEQKTGFVTRIKGNAKYEYQNHSRDHSQWCLSDEIIQVEVDKGMKTKLKLKNNIL